MDKIQLMENGCTDYMNNTLSVIYHFVLAGRNVKMKEGSLTMNDRYKFTKEDQRVLYVANT